MWQEEFKWNNKWNIYKKKTGLATEISEVRLRWNDDRSERSSSSLGGELVSDLEFEENRSKLLFRVNMSISVYESHMKIKRHKNVSEVT